MNIARMKNDQLKKVQDEENPVISTVEGLSSTWMGSWSIIPSTEPCEFNSAQTKLILASSIDLLKEYTRSGGNKH